MTSLEHLYKKNYLKTPYFPYDVRVDAPMPMGWWEEVGTVLKYQYKPLLNTIESIGKFEEDVNFKPENHIDFTYENPSYLMNARSMDELTWMRENQTEMLKVKENMGKLHWHSMLAGAMIDPLTWMIPYSLAGKTVMQGIKSGAKAGLLYGGVSEGLRTPFDPTNTQMETMMNIGSSTVFGGALGGIVKTPMAVARYKRSVKKAHSLNDDMIRKFSQTVRNTEFNAVNLADQYKVNIKTGKVQQATKAKTGQQEDVDSRYVNARYNKDTNTIHIDKQDILNQFKEKPWTKPKVKGVKPLPENAFESPQEWYNFVLLHELEHSKIKQRTGESTASYENRINESAVKRFEEEQQKIKDTFEPEDIWDLAFPNYIGNIVSSPYRSAIQFASKAGVKLPDRVKKYFHLGFMDGGVTVKAHFLGKSLTSVLQSLGKHWGQYANYTRMLEDLHYQQIKGLENTVEAPRSYFGYRHRDKLWTQKNGNTFGEFLERAVTYYILNISDETIESLTKGGKLNDLTYLKFNPDEHFNGKPITAEEKKASKVIENFFKEYEKEGKNAKMFSIHDSVDALRGSIPRLMGLLKQSESRLKKYPRSKKIQKGIKDIKELMAKNKKTADTLEKQINDESKTITPPWEESYFARIIDKIKVLKHRDMFKQIVVTWFTHRPFKITYDYKTKKIVTKKFSDNPNDIDKRADKFIDELLATDNPETFAEMLAPLRVSSLNPRSFEAPNFFGVQATDGQIWRVSDFMVLDPASVMKNYVQRIAPKIEFKKKFGMSEKDVLEDIELSMMQFDLKDIAKIKQKFDVMYRRVVGQVVESPDRWDNELTNWLRAPAVITYLSDSGRAAIVDSGNIIFQYGFKPFQKAMETMVDPKSWGKFTKVSRGSGEGSIESLRGSIQQKVVDANLTHPVSRSFGATRDRLVDYSMELNFLRPLTTFFKEMINIFSTQDIIVKSFNYDSLTVFEKANLARHGVSESLARKIAKQKKNMTQSDDKTRWFAEIDKWDDEEALQGFLAANQTYMNLGSLTATASDKFQLVDGVVHVPYKPWMKKFGLRPDGRISAGSTPAGWQEPYVRLHSGLMSLPFIFWNYGLAANQKILQAGFDPTRPLFHRLAGASIMIGLGYMITRLRISDDVWERMSFQDRMARAVHMSGVTGMYSDLMYMNLHMYHGATGGGTGDFFIRPMYNPNSFDTIMEPFGAAYGLVGDVGRSGYTMATEGIGQGLAQMPYPLQYNMFIRDEIRELRRRLSN
tara:strand:+ start:5184 stop:8924 length:3741 start_codon:yes stop_codon:yes gene_type:complete